MKDIFITGATGFLGQSVCRKLINEGFRITALTRYPQLLPEEVECIRGDITEISEWKHRIQKADVIINIIGIIREFPSKSVTFRKLHVDAVKELLRSAGSWGTERFIHISANGIDEEITEYQKTKLEAEELIKSSSLTYTIIRPSLVYGKEDKFINMLADSMRLAPFFPLFGKGDYPLQPVSVNEIADIVTGSLTSAKSFNRIFTACGKKQLTYRELLKLIMRITGRKRLLIPVPEVLVLFMAKLLGRFSVFPLTADQFRMLKQGNICNSRSVFEELNIEERDLESELASYLQQHD